MRFARPMRTRNRQRLGGVRRQYRQGLLAESLEAKHLLAADVILVDDTATVRQNQAAEVLDVLANDTFLEGYEGPQEISAVSYGSEGGSIQISEDRMSILYAPPADYAGVETFTYFVDGAAVAKVNVTVESPLREDEYEIPPDGQLHRLEVLANDPFWPDYNGNRQITLTSVSSAGSDVSISDDGKALLYRPSEENSVRDRIVYIVDEIYPATVTIHRPTTVEPDRFDVVQNTSQNRLDVLSNDPLWPGYSGERRITSVTASNLEAEIEISEDGKLLYYTPAPNTHGWDSFFYVIDDRFESHASVAIRRPVVDDRFEIDRNSTNQVFDVLGNDRYQDLNRRYHDVVDVATAVTQPESGGLAEVVNGGTAVRYTPPVDFSGVDRFSYIADDTHEALVTVMVTRPVRDDHLVAFQDTPGFALEVTANDFYGNGYQGERVITSVSETAEGAQLVINGDHIAYTPPDGFVGWDTFTYQIDDDLEANVSVTVRALAESDYFSFCADPTHGAYALPVLQDDNFRFGYRGPAIITSVESQNDGATVTISPDGKQLMFEPGPGANSLTYTVDGKYSADVHVGIRSQLADDSTVVDQNSGLTSINVLGNDFRLHGRYVECLSSQYRGDRVITGVSESEHGGVVSLSEDGDSVLYKPPADFVGTDRFTYEVDGVMQSTAWVHVIRRVRDDVVRVAPGQSETLRVLVNDIFGADYRGAQQITDVTASTLGGQVEIAEDGRTLLYTAPADADGTDELTYTVDGALKANVEIQVRGEEVSPFPRFDTLADFEQFLLDDALARYDHLFGQRAWGGWFFDAADGGFEMGPAANRDHSETNVQVAGVDEADLMEFDSDYLYMLTGNDLVILNAWPAEELSELSRHTIEGQPIGQYLKGDRLTVISQSRPYFSHHLCDCLAPGFDVDLRVASDAIWPFHDFASTTIVTVFDVTDRAEPTVVQKTKFDGRYVESRAVGDYVYVAVTNNAVAPEPKIIEDPPEENENGELQRWASGIYETKEEYIERFRAATGEFVEEALPNFFSYDETGELARSGLLHEPEDIYRRIEDGATSLVSLVSVDITNTEPGLSAGAGVYTTGAAKVYASLDNFYVFESAYSQEAGPTTRILKFDWDGETGEADFVAKGLVEGYMLNQFSADEYDGHLRIATNVTNPWTRRSENDLFVLREDSGVLEFVGSLQNLAVDESIRSVRFMGPQAFIVTFRNVDPLFGLDVSDHLNPRSLGHLTLPGFSQYMHMVGEDRLLTVGRNTPDGGSGPAQVSLFDVSDLSRPRLIDEYTFERYSITEAAVDHHAFGYFARHDLLAVPATRRFVERVDLDGDGYRETRQQVVEHELAVFRIDVDATPGSDQGVVPVSQIEHDSLVRRSGYIDDKLYSIAEDSVKVVDVAAPDVVLATASDLLRIEDPPPPVPLRLDDEVQDAIGLAQQDLASRLGVAAGDVFAVIAEPRDQKWQFVFRADDRYFLYEGRGNQVTLIEEDFEFEDPHDVVDWQNPNDEHDVNDDGVVAPNDAILLINALSESGSQQLPSRLVLRQIDDDIPNYLDTSGDGFLSPLDALLVINRLNQQGSTRIATNDIDFDDPSSVEREVIDRVFLDTLELAGDSNLDGQFDSSDLVQVFQRGEYEDAIERNSTWADGDWDGDRDFTSSDLVLAFRFGKYEAAAAKAELVLDLL